MAIEFRCPSCQRLLRVPDEAAGAQAQCPECGTVAAVPAAGPAAPSGGEGPTGPGGPSASSPFGPAGQQPSRPPGEENPYQAPSAYSPYAQRPYGPAEAAALAAARVSGPATALLVTGWLWIVLQACGTVANLAQVGMQFPFGRQQPMPVAPEVFLGINLVTGLISIGMGVLIVVGATKMRNLESYSLSMTAAIVAMIPCSGCCLLGLPFGIWALVVLNDPWVKSAFRS
jgi:hypothetical protein